jgi:rare lipoprotein A
MKQLVLIFTLVLTLAGCGHKPATVAVSPAPPIEPSSSEQTSATASPPSKSAPQKAPQQETDIAPNAPPLLTETGIASWYGAPYHNRRGSNGEVYDMRAMTAAHRTLPLGSIVRVTSLDTQSSAIVRITDRGPFIEGRVIDLSRAAAEKIGLVQRGTGRVRLELLKTPQPIDPGGRWAVQIGGFREEGNARDVAGSLSRRYQTAKVLTFNSPAGDWWVRVRVKDDLRARAEEVMHDARTSEGAVFLVRLD